MSLTVYDLIPHLHKIERISSANKGTFLGLYGEYSIGGDVVVIVCCIFNSF